ncbi:hypothetical protein PALB_9730 [Pseudoalteromonas luteoviolacea B = ATCC 29581]|nr:hypothetical protein PALB_9730 [Pseudoalteromonas luteoviolacea B = ATCC 29581]
MIHFIRGTWLDYQVNLMKKRNIAFLCLLLFLSFGFYPVPEDGYFTLSIAGHLGEYNSAWMAVTYCFLTTIVMLFFGFYFMKGGISEDRQSLRGKLIASSHICNVEYLSQKTLSCFLVLATMTFIGLLCAIALNLLMYTKYPFELGAFSVPFLVLLLPQALLCAAFCTLFDAHPKLSGAVGNVTYFFVFVAILGALEGNIPGFVELTEQIRTHLPQEALSRSNLNVGMMIDSEENLRAMPTIFWSGLVLNASVLNDCMVSLLMSAGIVILASFVFDRFALEPKVDTHNAKTSRWPSVKSVFFPNLFIKSTALRLFLCEVNLAAKQVNPTLWIVLLAMNFAILLVQDNAITTVMIGIVFLLNLGVLGKVGVREEVSKINLVLNYLPTSSSLRLLLQVLATWLFVCSTQLGSLLWLGVNLTLLHSVYCLIGVLMWVNLSMLLGTSFKNRHIFDLLFLFVWYLGPMNGLSQLDFIGITTLVDAKSVMLLSLASVAMVCITMVLRKFRVYV